MDTGFIIAFRVTAETLKSMCKYRELLHNLEYTDVKTIVEQLKFYLWTFYKYR